MRHEPILARPVRIPGRVIRWCHREPMLAAATFSLVGLIAATAVLTTVLYRREKHTRLALEQRSDSELRALMKRIASEAE